MEQPEVESTASGVLLKVFGEAFKGVSERYMYGYMGGKTSNTNIEKEATRKLHFDTLIMMKSAGVSAC